MEAHRSVSGFLFLLPGEWMFEPGLCIRRSGLVPQLPGSFCPVSWGGGGMKSSGGDFHGESDSFRFSSGGSWHISGSLDSTKLVAGDSNPLIVADSAEFVAGLSPYVDETKVMRWKKRGEKMLSSVCWFRTVDKKIKFAKHIKADGRNFRCARLLLSRFFLLR